MEMGRGRGDVEGESDDRPSVVGFVHPSRLTAAIRRAFCVTSATAALPTSPASAATPRRRVPTSPPPSTSR